MYRKLKSAVPPHNMPSKVHLLEKFPENSHGKINRDVLMSKVKHCEEDNNVKSSCIVSKSEIFNLLVDCWESFCASKPRGHDNFVLCGGDSFSALAFINLLRYLTFNTFFVPTSLVFSEHV